MAVERTKYALKKPIERAGETISELAFRELRAGDLRSFPLERQTAGDILDIAGKLCGQPPDVIDALGVEDLVGIGKLVTGFLPPGLLTGIGL